MKLQIDLKSAVVGLALGIGAMLAMGAGEGSSEGIGRYQATGAVGFFMITDTVTGQSWAANLATPGLTGVQAGFYDRKR